MTQGTTKKSAFKLRAGQPVTAWPDPNRGPAIGTAGRWTVTEQPLRIGEMVRVDYLDEHHTPGVWVLHTSNQVRVELTRSEQHAAAARLIADFADDPDLPEIYSWRIEDEGIVAHLSSGLRGEDKVRADLAVWAGRLDGTVVERVNGQRLELEVRVEWDGLPIQVWTSVYLPTDAAPAEKAEVSA